MNHRLKTAILTIVLILWSLSARKHLAYAAGNVARQLVYLNIPAYRLILYTQYGDGHWERLPIPVGIGRGPHQKYQTPTGQGQLYAKATGVSFQYGPQNPQELVGKNITHSNTFDKHTLKPVTVRMPNDMKSIFMKVTSDIDGRAYTQFVLHETTDWYTVGTPASNGCVRIERDDMHQLFWAIEPSVREGDLAAPVPIVVYYDVAEYYADRQMVVLHANVYERQVDYIHEVLRDLIEAGIDTRFMNMAALLGIVRQAEMQFSEALATIRSRLKKPPFERLVHDYEKQQLHFTFYLKFQY